MEDTLKKDIFAHGRCNTNNRQIIQIKDQEILIVLEMIEKCSQY
jgi:hypothetical protein